MKGSTNSESSIKNMKPLLSEFRHAIKELGLPTSLYSNFVQETIKAIPYDALPVPQHILKQRKELVKEKIIEYLESQDNPDEGVVEGGIQGGKKKKPKKKSKKRSKSFKKKTKKRSKKRSKSKKTY